MTSRNRHLPLVLGLLVFSGVLVTLAVMRLSAPPQTLDLERLGAVQFESARDFIWPDFVDEEGAPFAYEDFKNHWTLIFFGFSHCPDICPATMSVFARTQERLARDDLRHDTRYIMISVDPERDTPTRLKMWLTQFNASLKALRGDLRETRKLARAFSVSFQKAPHTGADYNINHSANVFLVGPDGKQHGFVWAATNAQSLEQAYRAIRKRFDIRTRPTFGA